MRAFARTLLRMLVALALSPAVAPSADDMGRTAVDVRQVVRALVGNVVADQMVQHVYVVRDGLIGSMEIRTS